MNVFAYVKERQVTGYICRLWLSNINEFIDRKKQYKNIMTLAKFFLSGENTATAC